MSPRPEFNTVVERMTSFFVPRNHTNLRGLCVFEY